MVESFLGPQMAGNSHWTSVNPYMSASSLGSSPFFYFFYYYYYSFQVMIRKILFWNPRTCAGNQNGRS